MKEKVSTIFLDIGGVILTNGWDTSSRELAAKTFQLNFKETESRHRLLFDLFELGKLSLDEYVTHVYLSQKQNVSLQDFKNFMFSQSKPYPEMLKLIKELKKKHALKIVMLSNEGRELTHYRIEQFQLRELIDFFISSSLVGLKKPDPAIYKLALDTSQTPPGQVVYLDDRELFIEIAEGFGIQGVWHRELTTTKDKLASYGLT